jgi:hypothetical protein
MLLALHRMQLMLDRLQATVMFGNAKVDKQAACITDLDVDSLQ